MNSLFSNNSPLWNITNKILNFLWLSLLWFLCSLPVITVGASTAALYQVMLKYVRNEEGYLTTSYFRAFRRNFRQATAVWLLLLPAGLLLTINFVLYNRLEQEGTAGFLFMILGFGVSLSFAFMNLYVYAVLAKFQNTLFRIITNSWIMALYQRTDACDHTAHPGVWFPDLPTIAVLRSGCDLLSEYEAADPYF